MLIGNLSTKPKLEHVRRIKKTLSDVLALPDSVIISVNQLACLEQDCAPLETVIVLLRPELPQLQNKIHKAVEDVTCEDLMNVCIDWGFDVQYSIVEKHFNLFHISRS